MPYIEKKDRHKFSSIIISPFENPGQLNYAITHLIRWYQSEKGLSYQTINDILGALSGA